MDLSFFKPLVRDSFPQKLLIPPAFVEKMEGKLASNLVLKYECGRLYIVKIEELEEGRFFFINGWPDFVKDHELEYGDFIVFRLIDDSTFQVTVYDPSMCEKYCCDSHRNNNIGDDHTTRKTIKVETNTSSDTDNHSREPSPTKKNQESDIKIESDDSDDATKDPCSNTEAPSFKLLLNEANKIYLPLPPLFVRKTGLAKKREIKLRDPNGKMWPATINGRKSVGLTRGWTGLFISNRLKKGDTCVFKFVRRGGIDIIQVDVKRGRGRPPKNR